MVNVKQYKVNGAKVLKVIFEDAAQNHYDPDDYYTIKKIAELAGVPVDEAMWFIEAMVDHNVGKMIDLGLPIMKNPAGNWWDKIENWNYKIDPFCEVMLEPKRSLR